MFSGSVFYDDGILLHLRVTRKTL